MKIHVRNRFPSSCRKGLQQLALLLALLSTLLSTGCLPEPSAEAAPENIDQSGENVTATPAPALPEVTPLATRPVYQPGELVDYTAQTGDMLPALAARFNTTIEEIRSANPIIPDTATTMPPGMPMKIPIYYRPLWGTPFQILPDSLFINGPATQDFDAVAFVDQHPGWLKSYVGFAGGKNLRGGALINFVATEYSVSPRVLLALAEYLSGALTQPTLPDNPYMLGNQDYHKAGFYLQIAWAADFLNYGYYRWRAGEMLYFELSDGRLEYPDPWQDAVTVSLQNYFAKTMPAKDYERAITGAGFALVYRNLFGDPWENVQPHIPGSLVQPPLMLPFEINRRWAFTGGPHSGWGDLDAPLTAIDFAPPAVAGGCKPTDQWATAVAEGDIVRTDTGIAVLDLDGDHDERTGWVIFYLHLETTSIPPVGTHLKMGDRIGHPSCEGGHSTGTHVHMVRKYNGEWMLAEGLLGFNLEGWLVHNGSAPYEGSLTRDGKIVSACVCSDQSSQIQSEGPTAFQH